MLLGWPTNLRLGSDGQAVKGAHTYDLVQLPAVIWYRGETFQKEFLDVRQIVSAIFI